MMERAHVFFESLDAFLAWKSPESPVYAVQLQQIEPTSVGGMSRVTHTIHVSQLASECIHHCLIRTSTHIEPIGQADREANRQRADRAWAAIVDVLDDMFRQCVLGGQVSYPRQETHIYAALPESMERDIRA